MYRVATTPPMYKLIALVWFGAYVMFIVQGLRNRSGPRYLGAAGALSLSPVDPIRLVARVRRMR